MNRLSTIVAAIAWLAVPAASGNPPTDAFAPPAPVVFVVAPNGDDAHQGTLDHPFATLERARDAILAARKTAPPSTSFAVELRGGRHFMPRPFVLIKQDSGTKDNPIVYRPHANEQPVLYGGVPVSGFEPVADRPGTFIADLTPLGSPVRKPRLVCQLLADGRVARLAEGDAAPGVWKVDAAAAKLFVQPPVGVMAADLTVIVPGGRSIFAMLRDTAHVEIRGLTFRAAEGSAVILNATTACTVADCVVECSGDFHGAGIVAEAGTGNSIVGCEVSDTGGYGIVLDGGNASIQDLFRLAGNRADDNVVRRPGVISRQSAGLSVVGVGNSASRNHITDCPQMGILVGGNAHTIADNVVSRTNRNAPGSAAIFVAGRDFTAGRGTVIRANFLEDTGGRHPEPEGPVVAGGGTVGILLDTHASGVDVIDNVIVNAASAGIRMENGRANHVVGNLLCASGDRPVVETIAWPPDDPRWQRDLKATGWRFAKVAQVPAWQKLRAMDVSPQDCLVQFGTTSVDNVLERNEIRAEPPAPPPLPASRTISPGTTP